MEVINCLWHWCVCVSIHYTCEYVVTHFFFPTCSTTWLPSLFSTAILELFFFIPVTSNDASHHASVKTRRYSVIKHRKQKALENNFLQLYTQLHSHSPPPIACRLSSPPPFFRLPIGTQPLYSPPFHAAIISQRQDNTALRKQRELSRGLRCSRREGRKGGRGGAWWWGRGRERGAVRKTKDKWESFIMSALFQMVTAGLSYNESVRKLTE